MAAIKRNVLPSMGATSDAAKTPAADRSQTISEVVAASTAAFTWQGGSQLAGLRRVLSDEPVYAGDTKLFALGRALLKMATAYVETDARFEGDGSPKADRACAKAWGRCEAIVEEITTLSALTFGGLKVKAHAVAWIESDTKGDLSASIVADLLAIGEAA